MKFSILIANYNNGKYFQDCYESIIRQNFTDWEAIIIDDASEDNSVEIINKIISTDTRFKLFLNDKNKGCGFTKRRCIELACGELNGFVDPDDALMANALKEMNEAFSNNKNAVLIHSNLIYCNENLQKINLYTHAASVLTEYNYFFNLNHCVTQFSMFKKEAYLQTEGIDAYMQKAVDQDLYLKLFEIGKFYFINKPLYLYRRHKAGISSFYNMEKAKYWHWFAIMQAAKRRNINVDQLFNDYFIRRKKFEDLKISGSLLSKIFKRLFC